MHSMDDGKNMSGTTHEETESHAMDDGMESQ